MQYTSPNYRHYKSLHPKMEVDYTLLVEEHVARSASLNIGKNNQDSIQMVWQCDARVVA